MKKMKNDFMFAVSDVNNDLSDIKLSVIKNDEDLYNYDWVLLLNVEGNFEKEYLKYFLQNEINTNNRELLFNYSYVKLEGLNDKDEWVKYFVRFRDILNSNGELNYNLTILQECDYFNLEEENNNEKLYKR